MPLKNVPVSELYDNFSQTHRRIPKLNYRPKSRLSLNQLSKNYIS